MQKILERIGITPEMLSDLTHDAASGMAADANNTGLSNQLNFLYRAGYTDKCIWEYILTHQLKPGMCVEVSEPKSDKSSHSVSFSGEVIAVMDDHLLVIDNKINQWVVAFDEIVNFNIEH